jgi:hypothetical protein
MVPPEPGVDNGTGTSWVWSHEQASSGGVEVDDGDAMYAVCIWVAVRCDVMWCDVKVI